MLNYSSIRSFWSGSDKEGTTARDGIVAGAVKEDLLEEVMFELKCE